MAVIEHRVIDVQRFKEAVWAVERESFRPGDALSALEQAVVSDAPMAEGAPCPPSPSA